MRALFRKLIIAATLFAIAVTSLGNFGGLPSPKPVHAMPFAALPIGGAAGAYVGPGDVVSGAFAWYGLRAYSNATLGNNLIQLCTPSDAHCENEASNGATGVLTLGIFGSTCTIPGGGTTCTIKTWYDQSGNGYAMTQTTIADRSQFSPAASGNGCTTTSLPCAINPSTGAAGYSATITSVASPQTWVAVANRPSAFNSDDVDIFSATTTADLGIFFWSSAQDVFGGTHRSGGQQLNASAPSDAYHNIAFVAQGAAVVYVDDVSTTGTLNSGVATNTSLYLNTDGGGFSPGIGLEWTEAGAWPRAFNSTQAQQMCHNQYQFWTTSASC